MSREITASLSKCTASCGPDFRITIGAWREAFEVDGNAPLP
jgi:hypothetical protein